jgi:SWI/SNF-related matrix-associated actin-dependent regulator of chromatin subfamily A3
MRASSDRGQHLLTIETSLNLTAANRVFIVEPQWNPSVEKQAIARALRLGQGQSVLVTRYIMNRTVEQVRDYGVRRFESHPCSDNDKEMRSQQDRKLHLAEIGWEQSQLTQ